MSEHALASDPLYLKKAFADLGLSEIAGRQNEPRVLAMFKLAGHPEIHDDETAWCAAAVGAWLKEGGLPNSGSLMAKSYATYGTKLDRNKRIPRGAIAVWTRDGGGHVNIVLSDDGTRLVCIGGNQSNGRGGGVTLSSRAKSQAVAFRMPPQPKMKPVSLVTANDDDGDTQVDDSYDFKDSSPVEPAIEPPKSMATSKIGNTSAIVGTTTAVLGGAQIASAVVGPVADVVDQVSTVSDHAGNIISTAKTIIAVPKPGFWYGLIHVATSPEFVGGLLIASAVACIGIWFWRRQHRQEGV